MSESNLKSEIQEIARTIFEKPDLEITETMSAADVNTWNSLSFMQFLSAVEDKYGFRFKMMELVKMQNMGAVIEAVRNHIA